MSPPIFRVVLVLETPSSHGEPTAVLIREVDLPIPPHKGDFMHLTDCGLSDAMKVNAVEIFPNMLAPRIHLQGKGITAEFLEYLLKNGWQPETETETTIVIRVPRRRMKDE